MRYFLLLMMFLVPSYSMGEEVQVVQLPIFCEKVQDQILMLKKKHGEEMVWMGKSKNADGEELISSLWLNSETQTWSVLLTNVAREKSCLVGSGEGYMPMVPSLEGTAI